MNLKTLTVAVLTSVATTLFAVSTECKNLNKASGWVANKNYTFTDGIITGTSGGYLLPAGFPVFKQATIKAKLTPIKTSGNKYKLAGLGIYRNRKNYWRLALVESPANAKKNPKGHYIELLCMFDGQWASWTGVKKLKYNSCKWEFGKTYSVVLKMTADRITGTVADDSGKILGIMDYELGENALKGGLPSLYTGGFVTEFSEVSINGEK